MPLHTNSRFPKGVDIPQLMLHKTTSYHQQTVDEKYVLHPYMIKLLVAVYFFMLFLSYLITPLQKEEIDIVTKDLCFIPRVG